MKGKGALVRIVKRTRSDGPLGPFAMCSAASEDFPFMNSNPFMLHPLRALTRLALVVATACTLFGLASKALAKAEKTAVGQALPPLAVEYLATAPQTEGKPVLLEFWATWCPPCRKSIPHLNTLHEQFHPQGLVIIGVTKEKRSVVEPFLEQMPMQYFPALDPKGELNRHFGVTAIPHAILADKRGTIVWEGHPMSLKASQIRAVLE